MNKQLRGSLVLMITAMVWGLAFIAQSVAADLIGPFTFNGIRFLLAAGEVALFCPLLERWTGVTSKGTWQDVLLPGIGAGLILLLASYLQQAGIRYTTAGKAGFITSFYVVLVPVAGLLFLRQKSGWNIWAAVALAGVGLYLLSSPEHGTVQFGDLLELLCAICFTVHILVVDRVASHLNPILFSVIQFLVAGLLGLILGLLFEPQSLETLKEAAPAILYAGICSAGLGYTLQAVGQRDADPAVASVIMSLESVFSALFGYLLLKETMTASELSGCVLMFAAVLLSQLGNQKRE